MREVTEKVARCNVKFLIKRSNFLNSGMHHKALDILSTFTDPEFETFGKFLNSPFFNTGKKILQLYEFLYEHRDKNMISSLKDAEVSRMIFPDNRYNKSTFNALFADLHRMLNQFLIVQNILSKELEPEDLLREELFKRGLFKSVKSSVERSWQMLSEERSGSEYFMNLFRLSNDEANLKYLSSPLHSKSSVAEDLEMIFQRGIHLCCLFTSEIYRGSENIFDKSVTLKADDAGRSAMQLSRLVDLSSLADFIVSFCADDKSRAYFRILRAERNAFSNFDDEKKYFVLKKEVVKNEDMLSSDDIRFHYGRLMKYCIMKKRSLTNTTRFDLELFEIYRKILERGYYKSQVSSHLQPELYRNILMHALKIRKFFWANRFIRDFSDELDPDRRENLRNYARIRYSFERGEFIKAMNLINKIRADNFIFKIDIRNLTLMIHFELNNLDTVKQLLASYSQFLSSVSGLSKNAVRSYKTFVKALKDLGIIRRSNSSSAEFRLKKALDGQFANRDWVLKKYIALRKD